MTDDQGFDFRPRERRKTKRFEPPPWEQNQFEELARKRAEQEAAQAEAQAAAEAEAEAQAAAEQTAAEAEEAQAEAAVETLAEAPEEPSSEAVAEPAITMPPATPPRGLEEARMTEMLADLASEEPPVSRGIWKVGVATGGVMVALGAVFLFWGMAALVAARRTGSVGVFGGAVLLFFGVGFVAGGMYLVVKNLRQQGVL